jgi:hypothetical protein
VTRASKTERQNIHKGPVDWKIEAVGPAGPIKYGSSPVFSIRITNLSVHDADFFEGIGTGNRQFEEDVLDDKEKPIAAMPPSFSADSDCDPCDEFVLHPGDEWRTKTTLPPWDLKAMLPGTYWVRFSKYDAVDHTKDWSNRVSVTVVP